MTRCEILFAQADVLARLDMEKKKYAWHVYRSISAGQSESIGVKKFKRKRSGDGTHEDRFHKPSLRFTLPTFAC
ncbi:hypothetical protein K788_00015905 [Paraburkholderia caribensis MBA4]|uniref:Uncharacterized protein n=1 Tax=Paraburkholderia caribensis MBA4 TaxID=1323664 RepID=A0A0P0REC7_9BURK|nr:hypothetical protein K788_00015905 [Paraburkholderia caribensis MBA4]